MYIRSSSNNDAGDGKSQPAKEIFRFLRRQRDKRKTNDCPRQKKWMSSVLFSRSAYGQVSKKPYLRERKHSKQVSAFQFHRLTNAIRLRRDRETTPLGGHYPCTRDFQIVPHYSILLFTVLDIRESH